MKVSFCINNNVVDTAAVRMKHKHHIVPRHMGVSGLFRDLQRYREQTDNR